MLSGQDLANALIKAVQGQEKTVYFVQGHGERDTAGTDRRMGYSGIAQYTEFRRQYDEIVAVATRLGRDRDPVLRAKLARVLTDLECLRLHALHVLTQVEQGHDLGFEASMTKLIWSETSQDLWEVYDEVLGEDATVDQLDGMDLRPLHAQAMWSRSVTIWGGSSQVHRTVTAERVLGLPR